MESSDVPTLEEVEAILQMGIAQVRDTRVGSLLDVYDEMLDQTDATAHAGLPIRMGCTGRIPAHPKQAYIFRDLRRVCPETT